MIIRNNTHISRQYNGILTIIFGLLFIRGLVFVFLIPLWQGPDEPTHVEYIMRLSQQASLNTKAESDKRINERIVNSMKRNNYVGFGGWIAGAGVSPIANSAYPPFYSCLNAFLIKLFKIQSFENQIYFMRGLSLLFGLSNLLLIYLIAKMVVSGEDKLFSVAVISFAGFLPQYSYMSSTVNPENLSNLIITATILISFLTINKGLRWYYVISVIMLLISGYLTKKTIFIVLPSVVIIFSVSFGRFFLKYKDLLNKKKRIALFALLMVMVTLFLAKYISTLLLNEIYCKGIDITGSCGNVLMSAIYNPGLYIKEFAILFVSFWFTFGIMVFKMSIGWYLFFLLLTCIAFSGLVKFVLQVINKKESEYKNINIKVIAMLALIMVINFAAILFDEFKVGVSLDLNQVSSMRLCAQGRYLFPSLSAIACLFVLGIRSISPIAFKTESIKLLTVFMIFLNMVSIFKYLIPIYYL